MATRSHVRDWINAQSPRSYFWARDVPGSPGAVESALSRLARDPGGPIVRARQGLYWVKPARTRFGTGKPDPVATALAAAGPGSGPAGWSATQALGLSTQVPVVPTIAVAGRPPKGLDDVQFVSRSNLSRYELNPPEIAILEVLRDFPDYTDRSMTWSDAKARLRGLIAKGGIDGDRLSVVARKEHHADVRSRAEELLDS